MSVGFIIIYGAAVGFIASKVRGSGFGLWWDVYLGVAGSAFASCLMISGYFLNVFANREIAGMNLYSIMVGVTGALALIYAARLYHGAIHFGHGVYFRQMKLK
jgi:uncharacterized membrane protein YeaQ/YmgE (transglycosylase-associated protein family)